MQHAEESLWDRIMVLINVALFCKFVRFLLQT
jgi:hypothetical protein